MSFKERLTEAKTRAYGIKNPERRAVKAIDYLFDSIEKENININEIDFLYFFVMKVSDYNFGKDNFYDGTSIHSVGFASREIFEEESFLNLSYICRFGDLFGEEEALKVLNELKKKLKEEGYTTTDVFKDLKMHAFKINLHEIKGEN